MSLYAFDITLHATVYVKAETAAKARRAANLFTGNGLQLAIHEDAALPISDRKYEDPSLPDVSLSPAVTIGKVFGPAVNCE